MKKHLVILMSLFSSVTLFSQVGINTENPQQLFHTDGKSSAATTNPTTGTPSVAQQIDDVVITNQGRVGIGTIAPSEKLEVNGKTKINDLPVNGSGGFTATRTLVANNNGVVGVINGLPPGAYDGYNLTAMQEYFSSNATSRNYTYNQIVSTNCHNPNETPNPNAAMCYPISGLSVNPSYSTTFNKASMSNDKYIFLSIDYSFFTPTIGNVVPSKSYWVNYDIEILINGNRAKIYSASYGISSGAGTRFNGNKIFTINLTGVTVNPTNNTLQIKLIPTRSLIKSNAGTQDGDFATGSQTVMTTSVNDVSFFLYEK